MLNGRVLPCLAPVPITERSICSYPPCEIIGIVRCSKCKTWYCSQRCQINDWQVHKPNCEAPPPLEKPDGYVKIQDRSKDIIVQHHVTYILTNN